MTRPGRPPGRPSGSRPPEVVSCPACVPSQRCPAHRSSRQKLNGHNQTPVCPSCGKTPCRPSCPKFEPPPAPPSVPPARRPGGRPTNPELDAPLAVALTPAATFYEGPSGAAHRSAVPFQPDLQRFYRRMDRLRAIERAATVLTELWELAPLGTTSAAQVASAEAELRRVVRST